MNRSPTLDLSQEGNLPAVRGPRRGVVAARVRRKASDLGRADQLEVDVPVVLLLAVPRKRHLIAIRRKGGVGLQTLQCRERDERSRRGRGGLVQQRPRSDCSRNENDDSRNRQDRATAAAKSWRRQGRLASRV